MNNKIFGRNQNGSWNKNNFNVTKINKTKMFCTHSYKKKQTHTDFNLREIEKSEGGRERVGAGV